MTDELEKYLDELVAEGHDFEYCSTTTLCRSALWRNNHGEMRVSKK
jgi:hypothetical protein